jgi:colanic acid biosynthesis glycosyl transferase WcaI
MRILLLSQFFPPEEPAGRAYDLAVELTARGHEVTVLTAFPNYPKGKIYPGYKQRLWQRERYNGINVIRLPIFPDHSQSILRRGLNFISFSAMATLLGPLLCGKADVLWVYSPPPTLGIPASLMSLLRRMPFVYEIQDLWPETIVSTGLVKEGLITRLINGFTKLIYRRAAAVSVISPGFRRNLLEKGVPAEKVHVLPNWADDTIYRPTRRNSKFGEEFGFTGFKNIIYAGNMGPAQNLDVLLQAATLLRDDPHIRITLIGEGICRQELRAEAERLQLTNVRFIGRRPAAQMPDFYAWADGLLVQLRDDPLFEITLPSKSLAYMACGRPIVSALAGDGADLIRDADAGIVCRPGDPVALAAAIRQLLSLSSEQREQLGANGLHAFQTHYTRKILVNRYEELFAKLTGLSLTRQVEALQNTRMAA